MDWERHRERHREREEDTWGEDEDEYLSPLEEKKYETKNFLSFQELNKNYPEKERGTEEYLEYWKKVAKNIYDIDFDKLPSNFNNLTDKELQIKEDNLNQIKKSSKTQAKYQYKIEEIDNITDDLLKEIRAIRKNRKELKKSEEEPKINYNKPYKKLKQYNNLNKNSEEFAIRWVQISREDLNYKQEQKNFDSYTFDKLIKYHDQLNQIHSSSSKRKTNKYIKFCDKDVKNQLKNINEKIKSKQQKGSGIKKGIGLMYYNNPQQLINRLKLLVGSKKAGNTNPEIDNEIIGISDELVKKGLIMNEDYTKFMDINLIKF